jgi:PST family polysaccharide transporter
MATAVYNPPTQAESEKSSYGQILKSSALIGGSSVINIAIGIVRTKVMAVLLGPAGVGLFGLYGSIADLAVSVAGMGVSSSGVRQIAEAAGSRDIDRIARTAAVLRRVSVLLGLLGAALLIVFSGPISTMTFGSDQHAAAVSLLSIAILCRLVSAGQGALIQGMRRISDLAKMGVLGGLLGTFTSIPLVYFLRQDGIVPSLIAVAAMTIATSWWYSRKVHIHVPSISVSQLKQETSSLLKLGFAFMASGLMMMGSAYAVRFMIMRGSGAEATGLYQCAWTLGGLYTAFILQAMGADFYPRLTAHAHDNIACNRLVNEQAHVGLLLAGPGVIATITFAPLIIALFYTTRFEGAVPILRWICLGMALRVINWPMGLIILAKGRQDLLILTDVSWLLAHIALAWACLEEFGPKGAGIAFCGSYLVHGCLVYPIARHISGFGWSAENKRLGLIYLGIISIVSYGFYALPFLWAESVGVVAAVTSASHSVSSILTITSSDGAGRIGQLVNP